jgi:hypothetical protein
MGQLSAVACAKYDKHLVRLTKDQCSIVGNSVSFASKSCTDLIREARQRHRYASPVVTATQQRRLNDYDYNERPPCYCAMLYPRTLIKGASQIDTVRLLPPQLLNVENVLYYDGVRAWTNEWLR